MTARIVAPTIAAAGAIAVITDPELRAAITRGLARIDGTALTEALAAWAIPVLLLLCVLVLIGIATEKPQQRKE